MRYPGKPLVITHQSAFYSSRCSVGFSETLMQKLIEIGSVYLIHFSRSFCRRSHYLGWATNLQERIERHRSGNGARILAAVNKAGIGWKLARTWPHMTMQDETNMKLNKNLKRLCPDCMEASVNPAEQRDE